MSLLISTQTPKSYKGNHNAEFEIHREVSVNFHTLYKRYVTLSKFRLRRQDAGGHI